MYLNKQEIQDLYESTILIQDKIIQSVRIKNKFDEKRSIFYKKIKKSISLDSVDQDSIKSLIIIYNQENKFFEILKKGINDIQKVEGRFKIFARETGILKSFYGFFHKKQQTLDIQSITIIKYSYKLVKKYSIDSQKEFNKSYNYFLCQYSILKEIQNKPYDIKQVLKFVELYESEDRTIKKFYTSGLNDKILRLIHMVNPRQAATLVLMMNLPASGLVTPATIPYFGIQFAVVLGILSEIIKLMIIAPYTYHIVKKVK